MGLIGKIFITFAVVLVVEGLALSAIAWSFVESVRSSMVFYQKTTENNAENLIKAIGRLAEPYVLTGKMADMEDPVRHYIKRSEISTDKLIIKEIFILSKNSILLYHSDPEKDRSINKVVKEFDIPLYTRAHNLNRWKTTIPSEVSKYEPGDIFIQYLSRLVPQLKFGQFLISVPVYHPRKLLVTGSVHMRYEVNNFHFMADKQKEILIWLVENYLVYTLVAGILISWVLLGLKKNNLVEVAPPFVQKVIIPEPESRIESASMPQPVSKVEFSESNASEQETSGLPRTRKIKRIKDAIYIGRE